MLVIMRLVWFLSSIGSMGKKEEEKNWMEEQTDG
jgi:hypothetical protein